MENKFLGVSDETAQNIMMYFEKVNNFTEIYRRLDDLLKKEYNINGLAALGAETMKSCRILFKNLQEAKNQAVLPSDKEEIQTLIENSAPFINMFSDMGEAMLSNSTEEQIAQDNGLAELIGGALC